MTPRTRSIRVLAVGLALGVLCAAVAAAETPPPPPDKGGDAPTVKLTLLNGDQTLGSVPAVQRFVDRAAALSGGALTIEVRPQNDGRAAYERRIVQDVQANKAQLAWVGTRVWDTFGVKSFRAVNAPMLVDSSALETAVLRSDLPARMLAGLRGRGVVGLAVLGDNLRYPVGVKAPLRGPADYKGITFRAMTSVTQTRAVRALGARPSELAWAELGDALRSGRVNGLEVDLPTYLLNAYPELAPFVTLNVALWPRTAVLFANAAVFGKLSEKQRGWIRKAAREAAEYSLTTFDEDRQALALACRMGARLATASPAQLALLRTAFAPVYAFLRRHKGTADMLREIAALKSKVKPQRLAIPKGCRASTSPGPTIEPKPSFPEGVYRFTRTEADVFRLWPDVNDDFLRLLTGTFTSSFERGRFHVAVSAGGIPGCRQGEGTYKASGQFVTVTWTSFHGCPLLDRVGPAKLSWSSQRDVLRFRVAAGERAERLTYVHWESNPFVRIR